MSCLRKVIALLLTFCLLSDPLVYASRTNNTQNLAVWTKLDSKELQHAAQIQVGIRHVLKDIGTLDLDSLKAAGARNIITRSVFTDRIDGTIYFNETKTMPSLNVSDGNIYRLRAIINGEVYICTIQERSDTMPVEITVLPLRSFGPVGVTGTLETMEGLLGPRDRERIEAYVDHEISTRNNVAIDGFIRKKMESGRYAVDEKTGTTPLYSHPERQSYPGGAYSSLLDDVLDLLRGINEGAGLNIDTGGIEREMRSIPLVLIPYSKGERLPSILYRNEKVVVHAHSSAFATYIFLPEDILENAIRGNGWSEHIETELIHEIGARCGLKIAGIQRGRVWSVLDETVESYKSSGGPDSRLELPPTSAAELRDLAPVDLVQLQLRNDYAQGVVTGKKNAFRRALALLISSLSGQAASKAQGPALKGQELESKRLFAGTDEEVIVTTMSAGDETTERPRNDEQDKLMDFSSPINTGEIYKADGQGADKILSPIAYDEMLEGSEEVPIRYLVSVTGGEAEILKHPDTEGEPSYREGLLRLTLPDGTTRDVAFSGIRSAENILPGRHEFHYRIYDNDGFEDPDHVYTKYSYTLTVGYHVDDGTAVPVSLYEETGMWRDVRDDENTGKQHRVKYLLDHKPDERDGIFAESVNRMLNLPMEDFGQFGERLFERAGIPGLKLVSFRQDIPGRWAEAVVSINGEEHSLLLLRANKLGILMRNRTTSFFGVLWADMTMLMPHGGSVNRMRVFPEVQHDALNGFMRQLFGLEESSAVSSPVLEDVYDANRIHFERLLPEDLIDEVRNFSKEGTTSEITTDGILNVSVPVTLYGRPGTVSLSFDLLDDYRFNDIALINDLGGVHVVYDRSVTDYTPYMEFHAYKGNTPQSTAIYQNMSKSRSREYVDTVFARLEAGESLSEISLDRQNITDDTIIGRTARLSDIFPMAGVRDQDELADIPLRQLRLATGGEVISTDHSFLVGGYRLNYDSKTGFNIYSRGPRLTAEISLPGEELHRSVEVIVAASGKSPLFTTDLDLIPDKLVHQFIFHGIAEEGYVSSTPRQDLSFLNVYYRIDGDIAVPVSFSTGTTEIKRKIDITPDMSPEDIDTLFTGLVEQAINMPFEYIDEYGINILADALAEVPELEVDRENARIVDETEGGLEGENYIYRSVVSVPVSNTVLGTRGALTVTAERIHSAKSNGDPGRIKEIRITYENPLGEGPARVGQVRILGKSRPDGTTASTLLVFPDIDRALDVTGQTPEDERTLDIKGALPGDQEFYRQVFFRMVMGENTNVATAVFEEFIDRFREPYDLAAGIFPEHMNIKLSELSDPSGRSVEIGPGRDTIQVILPAKVSGDNVYLEISVDLISLQAKRVIFRPVRDELTGVGMTYTLEQDYSIDSRGMMSLSEKNYAYHLTGITNGIQDYSSPLSSEAEDRIKAMRLWDMLKKDEDFITLTYGSNIVHEDFLTIVGWEGVPGYVLELAQLTIRELLKDVDHDILERIRNYAEGHTVRMILMNSPAISGPPELEGEIMPPGVRGTAFVRGRRTGLSSVRFTADETDLAGEDPDSLEKVGDVLRQVANIIAHEAVHLLDALGLSDQQRDTAYGQYDDAVKVRGLYPDTYASSAPWEWLAEVASRYVGMGVVRKSEEIPWTRAELARYDEPSTVFLGDLFGNSMSDATHPDIRPDILRVEDIIRLLDVSLNEAIPASDVTITLDDTGEAAAPTERDWYYENFEEHEYEITSATLRVLAGGEEHIWNVYSGKISPAVPGAEEGHELIITNGTETVRVFRGFIPDNGELAFTFTITGDGTRTDVFRLSNDVLRTMTLGQIINATLLPRISGHIPFVPALPAGLNEIRLLRLPDGGLDLVARGVAADMRVQPARLFRREVLEAREGPGGRPFGTNAARERYIEKITDKVRALIMEDLDKKLRAAREERDAAIIGIGSEGQSVPVKNAAADGLPTATGTPTDVHAAKPKEKVLIRETAIRELGDRDSDSVDRVVDILWETGRRNMSEKNALTAMDTAIAGVTLAGPLGEELIGSARSIMESLDVTPDKDKILALAKQIKKRDITLLLPYDQLPKGDRAGKFRRTLEKVFGNRLRAYTGTSHMLEILSGIKDPGNTVVMTSGLTLGDIADIESSDTDLRAVRFLNFEPVATTVFSEIEHINYISEVMSILLTARVITSEEASDPSSFNYQFLSHLLERHIPGDRDVLADFIRNITDENLTLRDRLAYILKNILKTLPITAYRTMRPSVEILWSA